MSQEKIEMIRCIFYLYLRSFSKLNFRINFVIKKNKDGKLDDDAYKVFPARQDSVIMEKLNQLIKQVIRLLVSTENALNNSLHTNAKQQLLVTPSFDH